MDTINLIIGLIFLTITILAKKLGKNIKIKKILSKLFGKRNYHNKKEKSSSSYSDIKHHYKPKKNNYLANNPLPGPDLEVETKHVIIDSVENLPSPDANIKAIKISPPYNPNQIRQAYGVVQVIPTAKIPKVGIIGCYYAPNIQYDFNVWANQFSLPIKTLNIIPNGSVPYATKSNLGWNLELQLDIQSVYTICQNCDIYVFLSPSASYTDVKSTIALANSYQMDVISMSFGSREPSSSFLKSSSSLETVLTSTKCCYLASSGDTSSPSYPALNPNVCAVGGSTLNLTSNNNIVSRANETTWITAGAGYSNYYAKPIYQNNIKVINKNRRAIPDVSAVANPNTGVFVYCSSYNSYYRWYQVGGTSLSCPLNAGLVANGLIYRYNKSKGPLTTVANLSNDIHKILYDRYRSNTNTFYSSLCFDITQGRDNGYTAGTKYDIPTGLGVGNFDAVANYLGDV